MTDTTFCKRRRRSVFRLGLSETWRTFLRRRQRRRQMRSVDHLDDFRRRDIGLPPRGKTVHRDYHLW